jgi:hypothetical protein
MCQAFSCRRRQRSKGVWSAGNLTAGPLLIALGLVGVLCHCNRIRSLSQSGYLAECTYNELA